MNQELTVPAKPLLDERTFQQLLCAAYTLQQRHCHARDAAKPASIEPAIAATLPGSPSKAGFASPFLANGRNAKRQELTQLSILRPSPDRGFQLASETNPSIAGRGPRIWRTVEAMAIGSVFCCFVVSASNPWFSSHARSAVVRDSPATQAVTSRKGEETPAKSLFSKTTSGPENLQASRRVQVSVIAPDTVVRYTNLPSGRHVQAGTSGSASQTSAAKRPGFASGIDMVASDTVLRYEKDLNPSRKPSNGKALPIIPESLRSSAR